MNGRILTNNSIKILMTNSVKNPFHLLLFSVISNLLYPTTIPGTIMDFSSTII